MPLPRGPSAPSTPRIPIYEEEITKRQLLEYQLAFFIEASDDVDMTEDVAHELLRKLGALEPGSDQDEDEQDEGVVAPKKINEETRGGEGEDEEMVVVELVEPGGPPKISSLFKLRTDPENAGDEWTAQAKRGILHHLKEKGPRSFVSEYVTMRNIPIPRLLRAFGMQLCPELATTSHESLMYMLEVAMSMQLSRRERLPQYSTPEHAVELIRSSKKILVLTGAGISVSCGIPDFRSRDGLYAQLKERGEYDLDDPQQMFDVNYFRENPSVFYSFASQIYPSNFEPSPCHHFIKKLEDSGRLLRNYTQNIDTLESKAGIHRVIQCHGSFATASCLHCRLRVPGSQIEEDIMNQRVPLCTACLNATPSASSTTTSAAPKGKAGKKAVNKKEWEHSDSDEGGGPVKFPPGVMKPDITFFGEKLDDSFEKALNEDRFEVDLLLVIGTSLKVAPVADILTHIPHSVPQILINKTPIRHINPDIVLLGDADAIIYYLEHSENDPSPAPQSPEHERRMKYERVGDSHVSLFEGAEGGRWLDEFKDQLELQASRAAAASEQETGLANGAEVNGATAQQMQPQVQQQQKPNGNGKERGEEEDGDGEGVEGRERKRQRMSH